MDINNTTVNLFEKYANEHPNDVAVIYGKKTISYNALNSKVNQLAHYLLELGASADSPIALAMPRSLDFLIGILAILKTGAAYLPLDVYQPKERLLFLLNDSKAPILITQSAFHNKFSQYQGKLVLPDMNQELINKQSTSNPALPLNTQNLAYIIYTSGSTGAPKGVLIEHGAVIHYANWFAKYNHCQPQQRIDFSANPIFDMAVSTSLVPLILGLTIVICKDETKKNIKQYLQYLATTQINLIKLTPSYFKVLLQETKNNFIALPCLNSIILGGENLAAAECKAWLEAYPTHTLFNEYGPTETTVATSAYRVDRNNCDCLPLNVPIGKARPHTSYVILDENQQPAPAEKAGELLIGGVCLARGYLNQAELTREKFIQQHFSSSANQRWYKTGDLCLQRADGVVEYLGRIDDQVKIRGFRVEPGEIEKCLAAHPQIKNVAVVTQKDVLEEQRLIAYYILVDANISLNANEIRQFLQNKMPDYMIPTAFIQIEALPLTPNGKLDKSALPHPHLESSQVYQAPETLMEKRLAKMWAEELGIDLIGINDNFFELGGHSLSATRLVSKINHKLKKNISLQDFYQAACIANLIPIIKKTKTVKKQKFNDLQNTIHTKIPLSDFQFVMWIANTFEPRVNKINITARKRFQGKLNHAALEFAFQAVINRHEVLRYSFTQWQPEQQVGTKQPFKLFEKNIALLSQQEMEKELEKSIYFLSQFQRWPKKLPLIRAELFSLKNDEFELQVSIPHIVADYASIDILMIDLSQFYMLYNNEQTHSAMEVDTHFKKYIFTEHQAIETSLDTSIQFWEEYFQDASFISFPQHLIIPNMKAKKIPYSTYTQIPKTAINNLKYYCEHQHISINNGLCAILALAIRNCCDKYQNETPYTIMNIVRSTRDDPMYDQSIGCFLRVDPIKIPWQENTTLIELAKNIRQSTIETSNYQHCSNLIKLSAISTLKTKRKKMQNFLINILTSVSSRFLKISSVYRKILQHSLARLILFNRKKHFIINLNVISNFIHDSNSQTHLFGLKELPIKAYQEDLLAIDYVFEACFFYDSNCKTHHFVISANLVPEFREKITQEVIQIMDSLLIEKKEVTTNYQLV